MSQERKHPGLARLPNAVINHLATFLSFSDCAVGLLPVSHRFDKDRVFKHFDKVTINMEYFQKPLEEFFKQYTFTNPLKHITLIHATDQDLYSLKTLQPELQSLGLSRGCITDFGLGHLTTLPLQSLGLYSGRNITDVGLGHLTALPLQELSLFDCNNITDVGVGNLTTLPLQSLNLRCCNNITDVGVGNLTTLPLQSLDLSFCNNITDIGVGHLTALPLQILNLSFCNNITDVGLGHLTALPLQSLNLKECNNITNVGLRHLTALPLQELSLSKCDNITDVGLRHLTALPLQSFYLYLDGVDTQLTLADIQTRQEPVGQHLHAEQQRRQNNTSTSCGKCAIL